MDFFADDDKVSQVEAELACADAADWPALATGLAWHIRQRDTRRALKLVDV